jgi:hypothetical protein
VTLCVDSQEEELLDFWAGGAGLLDGHEAGGAGRRRSRWGRGAGQTPQVGFQGEPREVNCDFRESWWGGE